MNNELMNKWAKNIVNHSLRRQFEQRQEDLERKQILVQGEVSTEPLMIALEEEIIKAGGFPLIRPFFSNHSRRNVFAGLASLEYGNDEQIKFVPSAYQQLYKDMDGFVTILGTENPRAFENHLNGLKKLKESTSKLDNIRTEESVWNLTKFPTRAEAIFEEMSYGDYFSFLVNSSIVDYALMEREQVGLADFMTESKDVTIRSFNLLENRICELNMSKGNNKGINCFGLSNVPDGEVYTSPLANTVDGEIFFDVPIYSGTLISGVYLRFEGGMIVDYSAQVGQEQLKTIIETDEDAKKLGEFAMGTNYNVTRNLKEILFAEKIGGTIHLAIGCSYDEPYPTLNGLESVQKNIERERLKKMGVYSHSAQHIDIPKDFRNPKLGEGLYLDGRKLTWKGKNWDIC
ncbi:MAG: aminopeptidase [Nanoarchaeota archaeon]|nr:aminopeptidase [Nanoarchaeota archaeon]